MKLTFILVLIINLWRVDATDYCVPRICPSGIKHIACKNTFQLASACPTDAYVIDLSPFITTILDEHNTKRNQIAGGDLNGYLSATRMASMQWNDELAKLATLNAMQCVQKHDKCHNTKDFRQSGQNLGYFGHTLKNKVYSDDWIIKNRINRWWNEHEHAGMQFIYKFPKKYGGPKIGHFLPMVIDRNTHVGCGAIRYMNGEYLRTLIACNYATTNIVGKSAYQVGGSGNDCKTGRNANFTHLCSINEVYDGL
ncbi:antigen 5 like allergen Cul n 1-like [Teleopsis dalmanni]|uniref:antigen 5 like allergen Cul n 1-like n=1 Tax=Teleopsis dalmanni TaxID=139649 RepID=UPI0018CF95F8|nr:antigen 5 like allergen Cul n 1-like [Teleopsis dalmanni]